MKNLIKMIVLGEAKTGKTKLIEIFNNKDKESKDENKHQEFKTEYKPTIGVDFVARKVDSSNGSAVLQVWDTAGQERFKSLSTVFYRDAKVFLICLDAENINSIDVKAHIDGVNEVFSANEAKPAMWLAITKWDLLKGVEVQNKVRSQAADLVAEFNLKGFFELSAKNQPEFVKNAFEVMAKPFIESQNDIKKELAPENRASSSRALVLKGKQKREEDRIQRIWDDARFPSEKEKIVAILKQIYTKSNSRFFRIVNGCWARHHIKAVEALTLSKNNEEMWPANLVEHLKEIKDKDSKFNPQGTLASIINFLDNNISRDVVNSAKPTI